MNVKTIGIDLAKAIFQIHGVNEHGKCLFNKQLKRAQMISFFANLPPCLVGMEACCSAHYCARKLQGGDLRSGEPAEHAVCANEE